MLTISETALGITDRFFEALDVLKQQKKIRGLQTFTREHGISYGKVNTLKNNRTVRSLKPEYLAFLSRDYGVSCEWLLLGVGYMFKHKYSKIEESPYLETSDETHSDE